MWGKFFAFLAHVLPFWFLNVNFGIVHPRGPVWAIMAVFAIFVHYDQLCSVVGNFGPLVAASSALMLNLLLSWFIVPQHAPEFPEFTTTHFRLPNMHY